jgi:hypothetical protein
MIIGTFQLRDLMMGMRICSWISGTGSKGRNF